MKRIMELNNISYKIKNKTYLSIDNLVFYEGIDVFICGSGGSGKTTLLKTIKGVNKYQGSIKKNTKVEVVLKEYSFTKNTIKEELNYNNLSENKQKIVNTFFTKTLLNKKISLINEDIKCLVLICKALLNNPKLIFIDNLFMFMSEKNVNRVKTYLKKKKITLVNVSCNIEDALNYQYMIVMDKGLIFIEGKTMGVLQEEKILKRLGMGLPFYIDLSIQLKLYNLINDLYLTKEDLEGALWK